MTWRSVSISPYTPEERRALDAAPDSERRRHVSCHWQGFMVSLPLPFDSSLYSLRSSLYSLISSLFSLLLSQSLLSPLSLKST